ncbi:MAG: RNA polymerase sigma-70 factor [Bacteroidales bacterium]|jgi:RNA polymerase sigma-70 factor (ECF subfamily)
MRDDSKNTHLTAVRLKKGDIKSFEFFFNEMKDSIYYFAYTYFKEKEISREIVQDVFVRLWEKRDSINPKLNLRSYLFTIAKNIILDNLRKKDFEIKYYREIQFVSTDVYNNTENELIFSDYLLQLQRAIDTLPPRRKQIFQLSRDQHMSYREISENLSISVNVVENQISKALKQIRDYLRVYSDIAII